jgi:hypothetical protein
VQPTAMLEPGGDNSENEYMNSQLMRDDDDDDDSASGAGPGAAAAATEAD